MELDIVQRGAERLNVPPLDTALGHLEHGPRPQRGGGGKQLRAHWVVHERRYLVHGPVARLVGVAMVGVAMVSMATVGVAIVSRAIAKVAMVSTATLSMP